MTGQILQTALNAFESLGNVDEAVTLTLGAAHPATKATCKTIRNQT